MTIIIVVVIIFIIFMQAGRRGKGRNIWWDWKCLSPSKIRDSPWAYNERTHKPQRAHIMHVGYLLSDSVRVFLNWGERTLEYFDVLSAEWHDRHFPWNAAMNHLEFQLSDGIHSLRNGLKGEGTSSRLALWQRRRRRRSTVHSAHSPLGGE